MFATQKRHILVQNRKFWRILRQNPSRGLGCSELQEPKKQHFLVCNLARKVTHARKRNPWADRDELLHRCRGPQRNHLCQFLWLPHTGFRRGEGSNFGLLHWLASSPLQHSRTTVRVCDIITIRAIFVTKTKIKTKIIIIRFTRNENYIALHVQYSLI